MAALLAAASGHAGLSAALLSIREEEGALCDGLRVFDRARNLAAVDAREARYRRWDIPLDRLKADAPLPSGCPVYVYAAETDIPPHPQPPMILQSYLDAVLQGFLHVYGEEGVRRFIAETEGFETPIHADRSAPAYPRAVSLADAERRLFDDLIEARLTRAASAAAAVDFRAAAG